MSRLLVISESPHIHTGDTTQRIMWRVLLALVPAFLCAVYSFGIGALIVTATAMAGCVVTEFVIARYMLGRRAPFVSVPAMLTGVLLAFNLPSNLPVWIVLIGSVVAIGVGKMSFGGLGCNIFNPALVGRVFLLLSFPQQMTTWPLPIVNRMRYADALTGATSLTQAKEGVAGAVDWAGEAIGATGGSLGEVAGFALIAGGCIFLRRGLSHGIFRFPYFFRPDCFRWLSATIRLSSCLAAGCFSGRCSWPRTMSRRR